MMYKKASLSDVQKGLPATVCMNLIAVVVLGEMKITAIISFSLIAIPCMNPNLMH